MVSGTPQPRETPLPIPKMGEQKVFSASLAGLQHKAQALLVSQTLRGSLASCPHPRSQLEGAEADTGLPQFTSDSIPSTSLSPFPFLKASFNYYVCCRSSGWKELFRKFACVGILLIWLAGQHLLNQRAKNSPCLLFRFPKGSFILYLPPVVCDHNLIS